MKWDSICTSESFENGKAVRRRRAEKKKERIETDSASSKRTKAPKVVGSAVNSKKIE